MNPNSTQGELMGAIGPVADRLLKRYGAAKAAKIAADEHEDEKAAKAASDEMNALALFKQDALTFIRLYTFLSQIFEFTVEAEKRFLFFKHLTRLLEFGRERESVDLSQLMLTHHALKNLGKRNIGLAEGEAPKIKPVGEVGSGSLQEKQKALLREIIEKVNDLFQGELTDDDALAYVHGFIRGKMLDSEELQLQAANNSPGQFASSPTLRKELLDAIIDSETSFQTMSRQALASEKVREGLLDILLGPAQLYEALKARAAERAET
jgi:type I restriction enzyme R subunit